MSVVVEKNNTEIVTISEEEIVVVEKGISIINGGSSAWGGIIGNITDQIDLKTTLDNKANTNHNQSISTIKLICFDIVYMTLITIDRENNSS